MYIFQILDWYASALTFSTVGFVEVVVVAYVYGKFGFEVLLSIIHSLI